MNSLWLKSFIACAEYGSISKAARVSYISTTAMVQQLNLMEKELGFKVLQRNNSGIRLTEAGEMFYKHIKDIERLYEDACAEGKKIHENNLNSMKIAYSPNQFPNRWLSALGDFRNANSGFELSLVSANFTEQLAMVRRGDADACLIAEPKSEELMGCSFYPLYDSTYSFCMDAKNPLSNKEILKLDDIKDINVYCGKYPYLKMPFEKGLKGCHGLIGLDKEYDMTSRLNMLGSNDMFVIHSGWKDQYMLLLAVVDSDIPAGRIGIMYRNEKYDAVEFLIEFMKNNGYEDLIGCKV